MAAEQAIDTKAFVIGQERPRPAEVGRIGELLHVALAFQQGIGLRIGCAQADPGIPGQTEIVGIGGPAVAPALGRDNVTKLADL